MVRDDTEARVQDRRGGVGRAPCTCSRSRNVTFILSPAGSIESIEPTFTPMIWILSPAYSASVFGKYATTVLVVSFL